MNQRLRRCLVAFALVASGVAAVVPQQPTPAAASTICLPNMAYVAVTDGMYLETLTNCGKTNKRFGDGSFDPGLTSWGPDGNTVYFRGQSHSGVSNAAAIYSLNVTTGQQKLISDPGGMVLAVSASPDGKQIAYDLSNASDPSSPDYFGHVYVMNSDGSNPHRLTSANWSESGESSPAWSPDGKQLSLDVGIGSGEIWVVNADGSNLHQITNSGPYKGRALWSPDGKYLIYDWYTGIKNVYTVPVTGGTETRLSGLDGNNMYPFITNDWNIGYIHTDASYHSIGLVMQNLSSGSTSLTAGGILEWPSVAHTTGVMPRPANFPVLGASTYDPGSTPPSCPALKIFGLRGSRDNGKDTGDSDDVLDAFVKQVRTKIPGAEFLPVKYPAIPVGYGGIQDYGDNYINSMFAGEGNLYQALFTFLHDCQNAYAMVVGYSQGADGVLQALQTYFPLHPAESKRILAVATFGDPEFNPRQPRVDDGDYNKKLHGIWGELPNAQLRELSPPLAAKTRSFCTDGDPVCNFTARNALLCRAHPSSCSHLKYVARGWVDLGALWAIKKWIKR